MTEIAIRTERLVKQYDTTRALGGLDLEVRSGEVYGFVGPNGSGKTTTIRLLLDLIRPTSGTAMVLGQDPRADGVSLRRRIGYLPGDFVVDGRQTGGQLLTHLGNLRGGVPKVRIEQLAQRLDLDLGRKIRTLSKHRSKPKTSQGPRTRAKYGRPSDHIRPEFGGCVRC